MSFQPIQSRQGPQRLDAPYAGYWCEYLTDWVADKTRYHLTVDPTEQTALAEGLAHCPDQPIHVTLR
jgi:hypothetical protein